MESRDALERRDLRLWCEPTWLFGLSYYTLETVISHGSPGGGPRTQSPERKRASLPRPERMAQAAPAFGVSPSEKRTLDLITDHPMIPREHLALWLGVSEGRISQMMRSLVDTWGLSSAGANAETPATPCPPRAFATSPTGTAPSCPRRRASGARPSPPTNRAADVTWATASRRGRGRRSTPTASRGSSRSFRPRPGPNPDSELEWSVPTARSDRAYNWGDYAIAPDAIGQMTADGLQIPFYFEYELRARHPRGVVPA